MVMILYYYCRNHYYVIYLRIHDRYYSQTIHKAYQSAKTITYSREVRNNKFVISALIPHDNISCNVYETL
jgi:hypothetical protein